MEDTHVLIDFILWYVFLKKQTKELKSSLKKKTEWQNKPVFVEQ